jgi:hypothetical protein
MMGNTRSKKTNTIRPTITVHHKFLVMKAINTASSPTIKRLLSSETVGVFSIKKYFRQQSHSIQRQEYNLMNK